MHHDEDADVYINGQRVVRARGYQSDYVDRAIQAPRGSSEPLLRTGVNTLAIHCHQTTGGQYIDAGLVDVVEKSP